MIKVFFVALPIWKKTTFFQSQIQKYKHLSNNYLHLAGMSPSLQYSDILWVYQGT